MAEETKPEETTPEAANSEAASPDPAPEAEAAPAKKPAAKRAEAGADGDEKPAPKAKKEKPPALEDKPFPEFIQQHYIPALKEGLEKQGAGQVELSFEKRPVNIVGMSQAPECWQVIGHWASSPHQTREFSIYFFDEDVKGQKGFSCSDIGSKASTLESFLIDERKVDLGLLVFGTLQRLNAQKWLVRN